MSIKDEAPELMPALKRFETAFAQLDILASKLDDGGVSARVMASPIYREFLQSLDYDTMVSEELSEIIPNNAADKATLLSIADALK